MDDFLKSLGISFDMLTPDEKDTYRQMLREVEQMRVSVETIKEHISHMKMLVEVELTKPENINRNDSYKIHLLARLQNYILLEAMIDAPVKARKQLELQVKNLKH